MLPPSRRYPMTMGTGSARRPIMLEQQENGSLLVDWESCVGYCEISWEDLPKSPPGKASLMRVEISSADEYRNGFNQDEWRCFRLRDLDWKHSVFGYERKVGLGSPAFYLGGGRMPVIVRVARPDDPEAAEDQVVITEMVARGWFDSEPAGTLFLHVPWTDQRIDFELPAGVVAAKLDTAELLQLELRFGEAPTGERLPTRADPRFVGLWDPQASGSPFSAMGERCEVIFSNKSGAEVLLFNTLTTADLVAGVNRATVIGRKDGDRIIAEEIHVRPVGDQTLGDDPDLPRYLFICDSFSSFYSTSLHSQLAGKFNVHHPPMDCGSSVVGKANITEWLGLHAERGKQWDVISFNFGLEDHRTEKKEFEANLNAVIAELKNTGAKLIWVTSCPNRSFPVAVGDGGLMGRGAGQASERLDKWARAVIARHPEISVCDQRGFVFEKEQTAVDRTRTYYSGLANQLGQFLGEHVESVVAK